jgi:uncharacterized protein (DUF58 family)
MSLKVFHILFIVLSILLAAGCAAWAFITGAGAGFGVASAMAAVALIIYGIRFLKKSKRIIT